jgi:hypothetical protein
VKPTGYFFFFPGRGHLLGQGLKDLFLEAKLKEFFLIGLADDFNLIELTPAKGFQNMLLVMLNDLQIAQGN